jgi:hypothetical protein
MKLKKKNDKKNSKAIELIHNLDHENVTNPYKVNKKIYETQFSINLILKDKKNQSKKLVKA